MSNTMSNTLTTREPNRLATIINSAGIQARFKEVLGRRAPQFISSVIQVGHSLGPDCDPNSIIGGAMQAATLDLPINKNLGFAWLVPFRDKGVKKAQFQMGYRGYIQLALRSGQYARMNAGPVNHEVVGGWDEVGERILDFSKFDPSKPAAGYFFAFRMVNGYTKVAYWSKAEVEEHARRYSQSFRGGYDSPWKTHFDEMATKTVIANELRLWGIMSVELQQAAASDGAIIDGIDNPAVTLPDEPPPMVEIPAPQIEAVADDGDLGPQTTAVAPDPAQQKPRVSRATKTSEPDQPQSPHDRLAAAITSAGVSFEQFARWAEGIGMVKDCTSYPSVADIPAAECERIARPNVLRVVVDGLKKEFGSQETKGGAQ